MRLRLTFTSDGGPDMPTLIAATENYTEDAWGELPDFYRNDVRGGSMKETRELFVVIPDSAVLGAFANAVIKGAVS